MLSYEELKDGSSMGSNSINRMHSDIYHLRRPPSLSDSFMFTAENIERAKSFRQTDTDVPPNPGPPTMEICMNLVLKFLFHILLIAVFETVFFFHYVSEMEDGGILSSIQYFSCGLVQTCRNMSTMERVFVNAYIAPYVNTTQIQRVGSAMFLQRTAANSALFVRSWIYVSAFGLVCCGWFVCVFWQYRSVRYGSVCLETIGLVAILALYEIMFFTTIIMPYTPISSQEIAANTVLQLEDQCQLFK